MNAFFNNNLFNKLASSLKINESGIISGFAENTPLKIKRRLLELGFFKANKLKLKNVSSLGNVLLFEINNNMYSVRKNIAEYIIVAKVGD